VIIASLDQIVLFLPFLPKNVCELRKWFPSLALLLKEDRDAEAPHLILEIADLSAVQLLERATILKYTHDAVQKVRAIGGKRATCSRCVAARETFSISATATK
jgi:hypothetical protein